MFVVIGLLEPTNDTPLFCLHYVFLPRINKHLEMFRDAYARHHIRTARNRTPLQLWIEGHLQHSRGPEQDMSLTQARNIKQSVLLPDIDVDVL